MDGVIQDKEKTLDISETTIGNYGACQIAECLPACSNLEEVRLPNCGIKDEGAIAIFEKLRNSHRVVLLDLSRNNLTEKCFEGLVQML